MTEATGKLVLTPTQQKVYDVLRDGKPHSTAELLLALDPDGLTPDVNVRVYVSKLRAAILRANAPEEIVTFVTRRSNGSKPAPAVYQLVPVSVT